MDKRIKIKHLDPKAVIAAYGPIDEPGKYQIDILEEAKRRLDCGGFSWDDMEVSIDRLSRLRHEYDEIVTGNMHIHIGETCCLEIFITKGESEQILNLIGRVRAVRGIQQVRYTITPIVKTLKPAL